jgi:signal transduction histidine kinase
MLATNFRRSDLIAWADHLMASCLFYEGNFSKGIKMETAVVAFADSTGQKLLRAHARKMIAWIYTEIGKENDALMLFKESLPVFKEFSHQDFQKNVGITFYGMATSYFYLGRFDEALVYYDSAVEAIPSMDPREMALTLADRAAVLRDHYREFLGAQKDAERALKIINQETDQRDAKAYVQAEMALTAAKLKRHSDARKWARSAYDLYARLPLARRYVSVYKTISEAFSLTGNYEEAFETERLTRILEDSIYKWRKIQIIEDLRVKYETDRKTREIEYLNLARVHQESVLIKNRTALLLLAFFTGSMMTMGFLFYRKREKYHEKIRELESANQVKMVKERIANDLHDSLGSQLSTISLGLRRAAGETNNETISQMQLMTDKVLGELRDFIWVINKEFVSIEELEQRVNSLFWQYRKIDHPMKMDIKVVGEIGSNQLTPLVGVNLFRIIQEAVQNSIKHSQANHLQISLMNGQGTLKLRIHDDGVGFQHRAKLDHDHFGLANMHKRAELISGKIEVDSVLGQGTSIFVQVPISQNS